VKRRKPTNHWTNISRKRRRKHHLLLCHLLEPLMKVLPKNQWKDFVPLQKTPEVGVKIANITKKKEEKKEDKKDEKKGEEKKAKKEAINEDLLGFHAPPRVQTDRRERGGDRRGGNKGPKSGPRKQGQNRSGSEKIEVNDEKQFPSLATKA